MAEYSNIDFLDENQSVTHNEQFKWLYDNAVFLLKSKKIKLDANIELHIFDAKKSQHKSVELEKLYTPSRLLCNMFWDDIDWDGLAVSLGGTLRILECGCGNGRYGRRVVSKLKNYTVQYLGFDATTNDQWDRYSSQFPEMEYLNKTIHL